MPRREVVMTDPAFMLQNDGERMPTLEIAFAHVAQLAHRIASGHEIAFSHVAQFAHRVASGHENAAFCAASFAHPVFANYTGTETQPSVQPPLQQQIDDSAAAGHDSHCMPRETGAAAKTDAKLPPALHRAPQKSQAEAAAMPFHHPRQQPVHAQQAGQRSH